MAVQNGRALHFVFKIADRTATAKFYLSILGMKVLRHEEFKEGCDAACNGPYDNRWSKTMVGYGPEDNHFVVELTYNYNVDKYEQGNDFRGITIRSREAINRAKAAGWPIKDENGLSAVQAPGGYRYLLIDEPQPSDREICITLLSIELVIEKDHNLSSIGEVCRTLIGSAAVDQLYNYTGCGCGNNSSAMSVAVCSDMYNFVVCITSVRRRQSKITTLQDEYPVEKVTLASSNLSNTVSYWNSTLGLKIFSQDKEKVILGFNESQAKLEFHDIGKAVDHATAYGRVAFSVPGAELAVIDKKIKETKNNILTPLITLDTPGKASVTVIILADPDGHEICFVDDENFRLLSKVEPDAEASLNKYIEKDEQRKAT